MKLYQPVLFVGLGGTGCQIGAELERRLREEICGPDGTEFRRQREDALPYQLPDCLQLVYADVNQADLGYPTETDQASRITAGQCDRAASTIVWDGVGTRGCSATCRQYCRSP